jgi:LEA14-like dessication related protein
LPIEEKHMSQLRRTFLGMAVVMLAGCAGLGGITDFDEPEVELLGLEPLKSQGMEARFLVRLRIVNPNSVPLAIDGMAYEVFLRDSKVLSGVSSEGLSVEAYSEAVAEVEVAAGMLGSLALLRDLMSNPVEGGMPYRLNAKLSRPGFGGAIRVTREGTLNMGRPQ